MKQTLQQKFKEELNTIENEKKLGNISNLENIQQLNIFFKNGYYPEDKYDDVIIDQFCLKHYCQHTNIFKNRF